ncbi:unnamed protein product [Rotaria sp. Silwood2]|nr:unnamed protein product [Rotaria sp. Silwood2]CAF4475909.1 unnamed protein product [Rotaria sp. Silwood2]
MNCLINDNVQLLDLPDELILMIMNKVKPKVLLLCSIIALGNNRLEQLALEKCHSIDLTIDYFQSLYESLMTFVEIDMFKKYLCYEDYVCTIL